jgi:hypothetical protein
MFSLLVTHPFAALLQERTPDDGSIDPIADMLRLMRAEAAYLHHRHGDEAAAHRLEQSADEWDRMLRGIPDLPVSYEVAAQISIWEYGTIKNKVSAGDLENVGTRAEPRVRLGSLPLCPERAPQFHAVVSLARLKSLRDEPEQPEGKADRAVRDRVAQVRARTRAAQ